MYQVKVNSAALRINGPRETFHAHDHDQLRKAAHVFHTEWHGIRSATSCLPGHKIGISADSGIEGDAIRRIHGYLYEHKIAKVVYQGFSRNADILARALKKLMKGDFEQYVVSHVTSSQFEYRFEVDQQISILSCLRDRVISKIGSVKPRFYTVIPEYWHRTIYNAPPRLLKYVAASRVNSSIAFVPLENTLRKNLFTNIIGAQNSSAISQVWSVNIPSGLESIVDTKKCRVVGYQRGSNLHDRMSEATVVLNCTLAECQPMTQLEAISVGTPCLTGRLGLEELSDHKLTRLMEVTEIDSPHSITEAIDRLIYHMRDTSVNFPEELRSYADQRVQLSLASLAEFLDFS
ncbi:hypothetical protein DFI02_1364 [Rhizobium sp. PP-F2F-G20b]|nr:hypothetical protein DFI02_1364 [Rhizobium sp. PP-F2F-G20b]